MTPLELLRHTVAGEARNQSRDAWIAVTWSIKNRLKQPHRFGSRVVDICLQFEQYDCWWPTKPGTPRFANWLAMLSLDINGGEFAAFSQVVDDAWAELLPDPTAGSTHYHDVSIPPPYWTKPPAELTVQIDRLRFYRNVA